jgi:hypothetical protein
MNEAYSDQSMSRKHPLMRIQEPKVFPDTPREAGTRISSPPIGQQLCSRIVTGCEAVDKTRAWMSWYSRNLGIVERWGLGSPRFGAWECVLQRKSQIRYLWILDGSDVECISAYCLLNLGLVEPSLIYREVKIILFDFF